MIQSSPSVNNPFSSSSSSSSTAFEKGTKGERGRERTGGRVYDTTRERWGGIERIEEEGEGQEEREGRGEGIINVDNKGAESLS